jgi:hypothetical protein
MWRHLFYFPLRKENFLFSRLANEKDLILNNEMRRSSSLQLIDDSSIISVAPGQAEVEAEKRTRGSTRRDQLPTHQ